MVIIIIPYFFLINHSIGAKVGGQYGLVLINRLLLDYYHFQTKFRG